MNPSTSAFAALELEPGADRAAVEEAYRRLIKRYHPDLSGGDAKRAAEINRAYFELRRHYASPRADVPPPTASHHKRPSNRSRPRRKRRGGGLWPLIALGAVVLILVQGEPILRWLADLGAPVSVAGREKMVRMKAVSFDDPINDAVIASSIREAARLAKLPGEDALVDWSRTCHRELRARPALIQLDRCAAFDNAAAAIEDRDPMHDRGPFNASSVTARQMTAAGLLSNDYLSIERRLDTIRSKVALALLPPAPPLPVPPVEANGAAADAETLPLDL